MKAFDIHLRQNPLRLGQGSRLALQGEVCVVVVSLVVDELQWELMAVFEPNNTDKSLMRRGRCSLALDCADM